MKFSLIYSVLAWACAAPATPPKIRVSPRLEIRMACEPELASVRTSVTARIQMFRLRHGAIYLACSGELIELLGQVGEYQLRIRRHAHALDDLLTTHFDDESTRELVSDLRDLDHRGRLLLAAASADCSASTDPRARVRIVENTQHRTTVLVPFPTGTPETFAIDLAAAFSGPHAATTYHAWRDAISPRIDNGTYGIFLTREEFARLFRELYALNQRLWLQIAMCPKSNPKILRAKAGDVYRALRSGPQAHVMAALLADLGITERNIERVALDVVNDARATIRRSRGRR